MKETVLNQIVAVRLTLVVFLFVVAYICEQRADMLQPPNLLFAALL